MNILYFPVNYKEKIVIKMLLGWISKFFNMSFGYLNYSFERLYFPSFSFSSVKFNYAHTLKDVKRNHVFFLNRINTFRPFIFIFILKFN